MSDWQAIETVRDVLNNVAHSPTCQWGECPCREFDASLALLEQLAEAVERVAVLDYDPSLSERENTELRERSDAFRAALAAVRVGTTGDET